MNEIAIKNDLIDKINHATDRQIEELYGLVLNYFNEDSEIDSWDKLPVHVQRQITESIEQAEAGLGTPVNEVIKRTREKYRLND